jgi:hypothetical protein
MFIISDMDFVRAAIANAMAEDMTMQDIWACAEHAEETPDFEAAVNILAQTVPTGVMPSNPCHDARIAIK